jgi:hypothetical protein
VGAAPGRPLDFVPKAGHLPRVCASLPSIRGPRPARCVLLALVLWTLDAGPARGEEVPADARAAVARARNAFEYRDFARVVSTLDPWLHPPKIVERELMLEARELLGVTQFILGERAAAEEEFGQLLLLDPRHQLDPFLFPPQAVEALEAVRAAMKPVLEPLLDAKPEPPPPPPPTTVRLVELPPRPAVFLPFGFSQLLLGRPGWATLWGLLQVGGLILNVVAHDLAQQPAQAANYPSWVALQYAGLGGFVLSWAGSAAHAHFTLEAEREALLPPAAAAVEPFARPRPQAGATAAGPGVGLSLPLDLF